MERSAADDALLSLSFLLFCLGGGESLRDPDFVTDPGRRQN